MLSYIYSLSLCGLGGVAEELCFHKWGITPWFDEGSKQQDSSLCNDFASIFPGVKMRYSLLLFKMYSLWAFSSVLIIALVLKSKDLLCTYISQAMLLHLSYHSLSRSCVCSSQGERNLVYFSSDHESFVSVLLPLCSANFYLELWSRQFLILPGLTGTLTLLCWVIQSVLFIIDVTHVYNIILEFIFQGERTILPLCLSRILIRKHAPKQKWC